MTLSVAIHLALAAVDQKRTMVFADPDPLVVIFVPLTAGSSIAKTGVMRLVVSKMHGFIRTEERRPPVHLIDD